MTLHSDLSRLIKGQLDKNSTSYDGSMPLHRLVARYFEMNVRHINPVPRRVHFSDQTHASLVELLRPDHDDTSARDAWGTVFRLRQLIFAGANVNAFLSKNIRSVTGWDGLLWHYGMHHFHLSSDVGVDGFVKRSDHLLFAIVAPLDAYFVDVRPHPPKDGVEWVSQELLHIVHSNWPQLIEANVLHGVYGTQLTDGEMHQLRRKSMNYAIEIDGKAIAPLGGGMAGDGSSVLCTIFPSKLLRDLRHHEEVLNNDEIHEAVARNLRAQGFDAGPTLEFELVFLENLSPPPALLAALTEYRSHRKKNAMWILPSLVASGARDLDSLGPAANVSGEHTALLDQLKQISLYTDCLGNAHWSEPEKIIESELAKHLVSTADLLARDSSITAKEIELWKEHMAPVYGAPVDVVKAALVDWFSALKENGLRDDDDTQPSAEEFVFGEATD